MVQDSSLLQSLLLPILVILVIGIITIIGWLAWALTRSRKQQTSPDGITPTQDTPASADAQSTNAPPASYVLGLKHNTTGGWEVHVKGQAYATLGAVPDPQTREEVTSALRALTGFTKNAFKQSQSASKPAVPRSREAVPGTPAARPTSPLSQRLTSSAQTANASASGTSETSTRRITPLHGSLPTIDFAYEINGILDELLAQSPAGQGHTVRLQNVPGGITFFVDGTIYDEITNIPNADIQQLIRQATHEWERQ